MEGDIQKARGLPVLVVFFCGRDLGGICSLRFQAGPSWGWMTRTWHDVQGFGGRGFVGAGRVAVVKERTEGRPRVLPARGWPGAGITKRAQTGQWLFHGKRKDKFNLFYWKPPPANRKLKIC